MMFKKIIAISLLLMMGLIVISSVSAMENSTSESVCNEYLDNSNENENIISLNEENSENISKSVEDDSIINLNEESTKLSLNYDNENNLSSKNENLLGDSNGHSYKITVKPLTIYAHTNGKYQAKFTDNGKPIVGAWVDISIVKDNAEWGSMGETNSKGIFMVKLDETFEKGNYKVTVKLFDKNNNVLAEEHSTIKSISKPKNKVKIKVPKKLTAKYKSIKYFKITVKNYKGKAFKNFKLNILIWKGKYHWKKVKHDFVIKTNNKGIAKFNTKKLKTGEYNVGIQDDDGKYEINKKSKIIIKKTKSPTKKKSSSKTKIVTLKAKYKWVTMKKGKYTIKARLWWVFSGIMGYYNDVDIALYKNGKQVKSSKYLSTYRYKENGKWKWQKWRHGRVDHAYHRYSTFSPVSHFKVKWVA